MLKQRLETFGVGRVHDRGLPLAETGSFLEVRFRESLFVDFLGALHVHTTGETLSEFSKAKLATSLPFLCGLSSLSKDVKGQKIVYQLSQALHKSSQSRSPETYLQELRPSWIDSQQIFLNGVFEGRLRSATLFPPSGRQIVLALTPLKPHEIVSLAYYLDNLNHAAGARIEGLLLQVSEKALSFLCFCIIACF